jgi:hypothetical protein
VIRTRQAIGGIAEEAGEGETPFPAFFSQRVDRSRGSPAPEPGLRSARRHLPDPGVTPMPGTPRLVSCSALLALVLFPCTATAAPVPQPGALPAAVRELNVFRRGADGRWRMEPAR